MTDRLTKEREEEIRAALERWPDERLLWEEYSHDLLAELDATRNELRTAQERLERQEATIAELRRERDEARRSLDLSVQAWDATGGPREGMLALIQRAEGAEAQLAALRRERDDARLQLRELEAEVAADLDGSQAAQAVVDAQAGERAALDRAEAAEARVMELTQGRDEALKALDEREGDMHARIRAGYDHTVADMWRAKVAEVEARAEAAEAQLSGLLEVVRQARDAFGRVRPHDEAAWPERVACAAAWDALAVAATDGHYRTIGKAYTRRVQAEALRRAADGLDALAEEAEARSIYECHQWTQARDWLRAEAERIEKGGGR